MSQSYETKGIIHSIGATTEYGQNGFTKREFVVLLSGEGENPEYPNHVQFELVKDKCAIMDQFQTGNEVKINFNLGGRLWDKGDGSPEKCFVSLQAWKVDLLNIGQQPQQQGYQQAPPPQQAPPQQAPQQAPPVQDFTAIVNEYLAADSIRQQHMWNSASEGARAAINAACQ